MGKQLELFEREDRWVQRLWQTIPAGTKECVVAVLAQMGKAALAKERTEHRKVDDDPLRRSARLSATDWRWSTSASPRRNR